MRGCCAVIARPVWSSRGCKGPREHLDGAASRAVQKVWTDHGPCASCAASGGLAAAMASLAVQTWKDLSGPPDVRTRPSTTARSHRLSLPPLPPTCPVASSRHLGAS